MKFKLQNLHLKATSDGYTKIYRVLYGSKEQEIGFTEGSKIVKINAEVVENHSAQTIADKLNKCKMPFTVTIDTTVCACVCVCLCVFVFVSVCL